jgi:hypothetical protein
MLVSWSLTFASGCAGGMAAGRGAADGRATISRYAGERQLKRSALLTLRVSDPDDVSRRAQTIVTDSGGFIENLDASPGEAARITARVPSASLDATVDAVAKLGRVTQRSISAEDVTDRLIDLESTLKNKRALRDRLRALLERGQQVEELLKVEVELGRLQEEVERLEAQLEGLKRDVSLSLLNVGIERRETPGPLGLVLQVVCDVVGYLFRTPQDELIRIP